MEPRQQVAHAYGTQGELGHAGYRHQALRILRVEKHEVAQLVGTLAKLVVEQGAVERELYEMLLLRFGSVRVEAVGGEGHESAFARLLLDDGHIAVLLVQQVETSLNAQHLAEERRLEHHVMIVVLVYLLRQHLANQSLDVALLLLRLLVELLHDGLLLQVIARGKSDGVVVEEADDALVERRMALVYGLVEKLTSQVTQVDVYGVGLRLHGVHQADVRRLGVGLEA